MTTAAELRAAAEDARMKFSPDCSVDSVCAHILATVHADDDEAISDVWWRTLNRAWFADLEDEERLCLVVHDDEEEDPDNRCLIVLSDDGSWGFWEQCRKTNELHSPHHNTFRLIKTRGDVRRVCNELGIELKETPITPMMAHSYRLASGG